MVSLVGLKSSVGRATLSHHIWSLLVLRWYLSRARERVHTFSLSLSLYLSDLQWLVVFASIPEVLAASLKAVGSLCACVSAEIPLLDTWGRQVQPPRCLPVSSGLRSPLEPPLLRVRLSSWPPWVWLRTRHPSLEGKNHSIRITKMSCDH